MNKSTPLKNKKGKTGQYFTSLTEAWIVKYVEETDSIKRDIIIRNHLYKPIKKLCEVYCNKLSLPYLLNDNTKGDLQNDCFTHLITNSIYKFAGDKGKAFSYLSIAARNYYIQNNKKAYVRYNNKQHNLTEHDEEYPDMEYDRLEHNEEFKQNYYGFIQWAGDNIEFLPYSPHVKKVMFELLEFMDDFDEIENYFKLEVNNALRKRYRTTESRLTSAKNKLKSLWLQYLQNVENEEKDTKAVVVYKKGHDFQFTQHMYDYVTQNYNTKDRNWTMTALAIKLGIPSYRVKELLDIHKKS